MPRRSLLTFFVAALCLGLAAPAAVAATPEGHAAKRRHKHTRSTRGARGPKGTQGVQGTAGIPGTTGTPGKNGTSGTNGTNGTNGSNGTNGTSIVQRVRQTSPVSSSTGTPGTTIPLANNTWSQPTTDDEFLFGQATVTQGNCTNLGGSVTGEINLDGSQVASFSASFGNGTTATAPVFFLLSGFVSSPIGILYAPANAQSHTVTATVSDNCTSRGTVSSLIVDVAALR